MKSALDIFNRMFRPRNPRANAISEFESEIVDRREVIRDGIKLRFLESKGGSFVVFLERRTKPLKKATLLVEGAEAIAWRDDGVVPAGEIEELFGKFQLGTWPTN